MNEYWERINLTGFLLVVALLLAMMCCTGCASRKTVQGVAVEGSTRHVETRTDVARVFDSVFVFWCDTVLLRGDTTEVTRWRTQYVTRMQTAARVDTLVMVDTLRVTERVETAASLTWWQRFKIGSFPFLLLLCIGYLAVTLWGRRRQG